MPSNTGRLEKIDYGNLNHNKHYDNHKVRKLLNSSPETYFFPQTRKETPCTTNLGSKFNFFASRMGKNFKAFQRKCFVFLQSHFD